MGTRKRDGHRVSTEDLDTTQKWQNHHGEKSIVVWHLHFAVILPGFKYSLLWQPDLKTASDNPAPCICSCVIPPFEREWELVTSSNQ